jgi:hypothetical protein
MLTVEQRLERLEATARRWRLAALGLAGVVVLGVGMGADAQFPKVIEANAFIVRDDAGKMVGMFGVPNKGDTSFLTIWDREQKGNTVIVPGGNGVRVEQANGTAKFLD